MRSIYNLKPRFQSLLRPIVCKLAHAGVSANQVTIAAMFLSLITGCLLTLFANTNVVFLLVPVVLFIRMALNAIDGMLAREHNMQTHLGAFLNELGDVISDIALYLPFVFLPGVNDFLVILIVVLSNMSEMTGVIGNQIGGSRRYEGPMGKSDRAFIFAILALLIGFDFNFFNWLDYILCGILILLFLTIKNRAQAAILQVSK